MKVKMLCIILGFLLFVLGGCSKEVTEKDKKALLLNSFETQGIHLEEQEYLYTMGTPYQAENSDSTLFISFYDSAKDRKKAVKSDQDNKRSIVSKKNAIIYEYKDIAIVLQPQNTKKAKMFQQTFEQAFDTFKESY